MKGIVIFAVLLICVALVVSLVVSCETTGKKITDEVFDNIYDKYRNGIILDGAEKYTVEKGDRLVDIAKSFYGNGYYYPVIMLASSDVVLDPDKIQPGMVLTIPNLQKNMKDAKAHASIKGILLDCSSIEDRRGRIETARGLKDIAARP